MEAARDFIDLIREHGPGTAAILAAFGIVAWIVGAGGKLAIENIRGLLEASDKLREAMAGQLEEERKNTQDLTRQLADANANANTIRDLLTTAVEQHRATQLELAAVQARADALQAQLDAAVNSHRELQEQLRDTLLARSILNRTPNGDPA